MPYRRRAGRTAAAARAFQFLRLRRQQLQPGVRGGAVSTLYVLGIGILGPGLPNWGAARRILSNEQPYRYELPPEPRPELLPPNELRRGRNAARDLPDARHGDARGFPYAVP